MSLPGPPDPGSPDPDCLILVRYEAKNSMAIWYIHIVLSW